jgi:aminoglycoside phosphotransferase family enzyme
VGTLQWQAARTSRLSTLTGRSFPQSHSLATTSIDAIHYYQIDDLHKSENAIVCFCCDTVIKRLHSFEDYRYKLKSVQERQKCLLEGLEWNRKFTNGIHLGLARVYDWKPEKRRIGLGEITSNPTLDSLDPEDEYVLVMQKLPKEDRLDCLLKGATFASQRSYVGLLSTYVANMHHRLDILVNDDWYWGNSDQLKTKLTENIESVEKPVGVEDHIKKSNHYKRLQSMAERLRNQLLPIFKNNEYPCYFEQRVHQHHIKRCHGDLKARNIWIVSSEHARKKKLPEGVCILDAIDFNSSFCNIDTLSDFAMLAVDFQIRSPYSQIANFMIEDYLYRTGQTGKLSRSVLQYYLIEKAFVGALVSILYDNSPQLGDKYLQAASENLRRFVSK